MSNELERVALALLLWDEGIIRPESLAREVVDCLLDSGRVVINPTPTSTVLAEVRALPHAVPVDLWCTYGGADRETVEGFKDWLQERIDAILDPEAGR